jgi:hypothetical protein
MDSLSVLAKRTEQTIKLMSGGGLPAIGLQFRSGYCLTNSSLLDQVELVRRGLVENKSAHQLLLKQDIFCPGVFSALQNWALFWAIEQSVAEISMLCTVGGLNEEFQTAALFGSLTANLSVFAALDIRLQEESAFSFYFADCKSEATESALGADFAIIYPLGPDRFKVALFQAKIADANRAANVYRRNKTTGIFQLDQFEEISKLYPALGDYCYYAFWHRGGSDAMLRPTIRTVGDVYSDVAAQKEAHHWKEGNLSNVWSVSSLRNGTFFSEFLSLILPMDEDEARSALCFDELVTLLSNPNARPKHVLGVSSAQSGFALNHWLNIGTAIKAQNEEFMVDGERFDRDELAPGDPDSAFGRDPYGI